MKTQALLALIAALGLVTACSKTHESADRAATQEDTSTTQPGSADPSAASSPHQQDVTGSDTPTAPPTESSDPSAASTPAQQERVNPEGEQR